ncbi:MAG: DUF3467 domain-containing protein [Candidatus Neomarinimicrobiota bacterium]|nr:DUF3467 domain-containing protein [Candidatus Neomarinimicrobiota bacterium]RKY47575.1 MAG: DUF3467 domain-containing protein [Candidatus Neomarinimicrobiota bacterium]RKY53566.1 MAG: DUF3467 domain-containing protein [Candidatus Neomarinimicrobiota bacterium]
MEEKGQMKQLKIEIPKEVAEGKYSNFTVISHSPAEFVIDFARIMPGQNQAVVQTRVILTPIHAKTLLLTLMDNINKFEQKFGEIRIPEKEMNIPFSPDNELPN